MARLIRVIVIAAALALAAGCSALLPEPEIRFDNASVDIIVNYGMRMGPASHVGALFPGETTPYYAGAEGTYHVEILDGSGLWVSVTDTARQIRRGKSYTVRLTGVYDVSFGVYVFED